MIRRQLHQMTVSAMHPQHPRQQVIGLLTTIVDALEESFDRDRLREFRRRLVALGERQDKGAVGGCYRNLRESLSAVADSDDAKKLNGQCDKALAIVNNDRLKKIVLSGEDFQLPHPLELEVEQHAKLTTIIKQSLEHAETIEKLGEETGEELEEAHRIKQGIFVTRELSGPINNLKSAMDDPVRLTGATQESSPRWVLERAQEAFKRMAALPEETYNFPDGIREGASQAAEILGVRLSQRPGPEVEEPETALQHIHEGPAGKLAGQLKGLAEFLSIVERGEKKQEGEWTRPIANLATALEAGRRGSEQEVFSRAEVALRAVMDAMVARNARGTPYNQPKNEGEQIENAYGAIANVLKRITDKVEDRSP